jgi:1-acyl-sn-glycerol-3-phosphate acyltransferase
MPDHTTPSSDGPHEPVDSPTTIRRRVSRALIGNAIGRTVVSVWSWFVLAMIVIIWLPTMAVIRVVTAPWDKAHYWTGYVFRKAAVVHQVLNPLWSFRVVGTAPADPRRPYVVVSNHQSFVDILLISHLPFEMKWLSKVEMFKIPLLGWLMRLADDIPVTRGERSSGSAALEQCAERLAKKVSVMIFPEGTRSKDGALKEFKDGAFRLAIENQVPILPLAVHGTSTALRKNDWRLGHADAEVRILEEIPTDGLTIEDLEDLKMRTRARIAAALPTQG